MAVSGQPRPRRSALRQFQIPRRLSVIGVTARATSAATRSATCVSTSPKSRPASASGYTLSGFGTVTTCAASGAADVDEPGEFGHAAVREPTGRTDVAGVRLSQTPRM
ncbi:hypothetical protein PC115_g18502 [Phytophthora cactorum]|uniref:Uncharacterized protein n=1 Tax=Phytophthora cactorum TaxID=29920 RepID=A0A8T1B3D1_9STRA|nr:hypothetical protein PC115_g18502 [Phytophthora cactorum]